MPFEFVIDESSSLISVAIAIFTVQRKNKLHSIYLIRNKYRYVECTFLNQCQCYNFLMERFISFLQSCVTGQNSALFCVSLYAPCAYISFYKPKTNPY